MLTDPQPKLTEDAREKKVRLAKDVIEQLNAKKFISAQGSYFRGYTNEDDHIGFGSIVYEGTDKELQDKLEGTHRCEVCARGALFVAAVIRYNEVDKSSFGFADPGELEDFADFLANPDYRDEEEEGGFSEYVVAECRFFDPEELMLIEDVFENSGCLPADVRLARRRLGADTAMRVIMQHIIDNDGEVDQRKLFAVIRDYDKAAVVAEATRKTEP